MLKDPNVAGRGWALTQVARGVDAAVRVARSAAAGSSNQFFGYSLRTPRWRYTEWDEGEQGRELYDHDADPHEITNLANDSAHAQTVAKLSEQLREAAKGTFPASGQTPELLPGLWAPNLTDP